MTNFESRKPIFLLVEDDEDHAHLIQRTFQNEDVGAIDRVNDGADALNYLYQKGDYQQKTLPDIILLDINLPKFSGLEVLKQIKRDSTLNQIPVVMLTTSDADSDKLKAFENYANSYVVKPLDFAKFKRVAADLSKYWRLWHDSNFKKQDGGNS